MRNLESFRAHLVYQQGESDHLLSRVARAARCPKKNEKTWEPSEIKVRPFSELMIGLQGSASHGFSILPFFFYFFFFFLPFSFLPFLFGPVFTIYTHRVSCVTTLSPPFNDWPARIRSSAWKDLLKRLNSFMVYLQLLAVSRHKEIIAFDRTHRLRTKTVWESCFSSREGISRVAEKISLWLFVGFF